MGMNKHVFMGVVIGIYTALFIATFDRWHDSALISTVALIGLLGWFYGTRIGLLSIAPFILLNTAILFLVSGDLYDILRTYNPTGIILSMVRVVVTGYLHDSRKELKRLKAGLSDRIDDATDELDKLTRQLVDYDEKERITMGQNLHDGVGQYLTGMLLHSEALSSKLREAQHPEADLSERMTQRIRKSMRIIRQLSRSQLPIQLTETTLGDALEEMTSYFSEISALNFRLEHTGNTMDLPVATAQHLYRIAHETICCAIYKYQAKNMEIRLVVREDYCRMKIEATKTTQPPPPLSDLIGKAVKYRVKAIGGKLAIATPSEGGFRLECSTVFGKEAK